MKTSYKSASLCLLAALMLAACDDINKVDQPDLIATFDKTELKVNESMTIHFTGNYEQMVVWTGDEEHNYDKRLDPKYDENGNPFKSNAGVVVDKGLFTYSYTKPGVYDVVCIATNSNEKAETVLHNMQRFQVTVIDPYNRLNVVSAPRSPYYEIYGREMEQYDAWFIPMPRKFRYNGKDMNINIAQHNINLRPESDAAVVTLNGAEYSASTRYDLCSPLDVKVTSGSGMERDYKVVVMPCPELTSFSIDGVKGTIVRSDYDYLDFTITVDLPAGTDVKALTPKFTLSDANSEYALVDGAEQTSEVSAVDFSQPVVYICRSAHPEYPQMIAESRATVIVNH